MTYLDAHYARLRLADDMDRPVYREYIDRFMTSQKVLREKGSLNTTAKNTVKIGSHLDELRDVLEESETFTMSHNMHSLVQASAVDMPHEPLRPEDLPSKEGFLWLVEPISELDIRGRLLRHHAVLWKVRNDAVQVWWFADRNDNLDEINQSLTRDSVRKNWLAAGRYMLAESTWLYFYENLPVTPDATGIRMLDDYGVLPDGWQTSYEINYETVTDEDGVERVRYIPVLMDDQDTTQVTPEQFALIEDGYDEITRTERPNSGLKQLVCFWRLCQQTLSAREYEQPTRALRKQMIRRKLVPKAVTVIILRRRKATGEGQNLVEWDHRWVRRGHWRQAWFGPMSGERYQRAIYINPTICGPEDKPLIIRPHVNVLKR